jgi:hypothetical protein
VLTVQLCWTVSLTFASWNLVIGFLRQIDALRRATRDPPNTGPNDHPVSRSICRKSASVSGDGLAPRGARASKHIRRRLIEASDHKVASHRAFQNFATIDLLSRGRSEISVTRFYSRPGVYPYSTTGLVSMVTIGGTSDSFSGIWFVFNDSAHA